MNVTVDQLPDDQTEEETQPVTGLSELTLREAQALALSIFLLAPAPLGCAAHESVNSAAHVIGELFEHLCQYQS